MTNSRQKGARGEREWAKFLTEHNCSARRGCQFRGDPTAPDVICEALANFHFEVKRTEALSLYKAFEQATADSGKDQVPVIAHKRNGKPWLVVMDAEDWLGLVLLAKAAQALLSSQPPGDAPTRSDVP
jgi:Holliday junction resolvase